MPRGSWVVACGLLLVGLGLGLCFNPAGLRAALNPLLDDDETPERRQQAFVALDRDYEAMEAQRNVLKGVVKLTRPTVVHIEAEKRDAAAERLGRTRFSEEAGSGVIIEMHGRNYVITNRHVVRGAQPERIALRLADGRQIRPIRVWSDADTDIAVLEVSAPRLVAARIADSGVVDIGDYVMAMGSPFGLSHSVTLGIISAKGRRDLELGDAEVRYQDFLQTDAAINPGNSGGPLVDLRGRVIGINTAIASQSGGNEGIGFAIPINMVTAVVRQLVETGQVTRAFLGVNLNSKFAPDDATRLGLQRKQGAHVLGVTPGSPAEAAKLAADDVVLSFDGVRVDSDAHLINLVGLTAVGREVPILVWRGGKVVEMSVRVGDRNAAIKPR